MKYFVTYWTEGRRGVVYPAESLAKSLRRIATLIENYEAEGAKPKITCDLAIDMGRFGQHTLEPSM